MTNIRAHMSPHGEAAAAVPPDPAAAAPASGRGKTKGERTREAIMGAAIELFRRYAAEAALLPPLSSLRFL